MADQSTVTSPKLTPELIAKEEYEAQLFGFTARDYSEENLSFVNGCISKETTKFNKKMAELVPNAKPDFKAKFGEISKKVCEEITKSCRPKIEEINEYIAKEFTIPDNVLLIEDFKHGKRFSEEDARRLDAECEQLEKTINENAFFIHALGSELDSYSQLEELCLHRNIIIAKAEQVLNRKVDANVLQNIVKKMKSIEK